MALASSSGKPPFKFRPLAATDPREPSCEKDFTEGLQRFLARKPASGEDGEERDALPDWKMQQMKEEQSIREDVLLTKRQLLRLFLERELRDLGKNQPDDDLARTRLAARYLEKPDRVQTAFSDDDGEDPPRTRGGSPRSPGSQKKGGSPSGATSPKNPKAGGKKNRGKQNVDNQPSSARPGNEASPSPKSSRKARRSQSRQQSPSASANQSLSQSFDLAEHLVDFLTEPDTKRPVSPPNDEEALMEELLRSKKDLLRHFVEREIREPAMPGSDSEATQLENLRRYLRRPEGASSMMGDTWSPSQSTSPQSRQLVSSSTPMAQSMRDFTQDASFGNAMRPMAEGRKREPAEHLLGAWHTKKHSWNTKFSKALGDPNTKVGRGTLDHPGGAMAVGDGRLTLHKQSHLACHGYFWAFAIDEVAEGLFPAGITRAMSIGFGVTKIAPQNLPSKRTYAYEYPDTTLVGYGGHIIDRGQWTRVPWDPIDLRVGDVVGNLITEEGDLVVFVNGLQVLRLATSLEDDEDVGHHRRSLFPVVDLCGRISSVTLLPKSAPPNVRLTVRTKVASGRRLTDVRH